VKALLVGVALFASAVASFRELPRTSARECETVQIIVRRPDGSSVTHLTVSSLQIRVDGVQRPFAIVADGDSSVSVLLVLDVSASALPKMFASIAYSQRFEPRRLAGVIDRQFIPRLSPGDRVRIGVFGPTLKLSSWFAADNRDIAAEMETVLKVADEERMGPSPIWDVLLEAVRTVSPEPGRRAIVLLTDGEATGDTVKMTDAAAAALTAGAPVHVISAAIDREIPQGRGTSVVVRPSRQLGELADLTGGLFVPSPAADKLDRPLGPGPDSWPAPYMFSAPPDAWNPDPGRGLAQAAAALHQTYTIAVDCSELSPGAHSLEVAPDSAGLTIVAPSRLTVHER
jgi:hypothetical protein